MGIGVAFANDQDKPVKSVEPIDLFWSDGNAGGTFFNDKNCAKAIEGAHKLPAQVQGIVAYYKNSKPGKVIFGAKVENLKVENYDMVFKTPSVGPTKLKIYGLTKESPPAQMDNCLEILASLYDDKGNLANPAKDMMVTFDDGKAGGAFYGYTESKCEAKPASTLAVKKNSPNSFGIFYKNPKGGKVTLSVASEGLVSVNTLDLDIKSVSKDIVIMGLTKVTIEGLAKGSPAPKAGNCLEIDYAFRDDAGKSAETTADETTVTFEDGGAGGIFRGYSASKCNAKPDSTDTSPKGMGAGSIYYEPTKPGKVTITGKVKGLQSESKDIVIMGLTKVTIEGLAKGSPAPKAGNCLEIDYA